MIGILYLSSHKIMSKIALTRRPAYLKREISLALKYYVCQ